MKPSPDEKFRKILDAMLYGDRITKRYLYGIVFLTTLSLIFVVLTFAMGGLIYGLLAMITAVVDLIWWQSMTLKEEDLKKTDNKTTSSKQSVLKENKDDKQQIEDKENKGKNISKLDYNISEEEIRYILKRHKVKKDHREVMIDRMDSLSLRESPAYVWADRKKYYFLILTDSEPIKLEYPLQYNLKLNYVSGVSANPERDYKKFSGASIVSVVFSPFLPDYYQRRDERGVGFYKNLYRLGKDIYFTNTSARNILDITGADFYMEDEAVNEMSHGEDFRNAYKNNILWRDGVISSKEYKDIIAGLLSNLARADINFDSFNKTLEEMYKYNLITKTYVDFYIDYRKKYRSSKKS